LDVRAEAGWTVGGGLEWGLNEHWSVKGEYLYIDFGKVTHKSPVAVVIANPIRHLVLCFALFRLGICSVSLAHAHSGIQVLSFDVALGDREAKAAIGQVARFIEVTDAWFEEATPDASLPAGFADNNQLCRMALTSGSTGEPKVVSLTVGDIGHRLSGLLRFDWRRLLCLLGLSSSWGFWTSCATLTAGGTLCFSQSPFQSIRMIELFSIEYLMAATEQLLTLTRVAHSSRAQLPSLRVVETAGSVPTRALLEAAMMNVCRDIYCHYGASEIGAIARAHAREVLARPGFAGYLLPGNEVRITDGRGAPSPLNTVGTVRCRPDRRWEGSACKEQPWTDLGDQGWMTPDGELYVVGRSTDVSLLALGDATRHVSPVHEIEHLVRLEWDATDAAAVLLDNAGGRPVIGVGTVDCTDASPDRLEALLRGRGLDYEIRLFSQPAIPRTVSGKVNRAQLKALLAGQT
jgi:acyl-coenzyme A synthetase/AMP-(fatty) acid ligase